MEMRKVLIITASFYPDPYVGSVRAKEFAKWLPENGWIPVVLAKDYGNRVSQKEFNEHVNPNVKVHYLNNYKESYKKGSLEILACAGNIKKWVSRFLSKYLIAPDSSLLFWLSVKNKIINIIREIQPDVVITTGPPHSIHVNGFWLKNEFPDLPWVADFRDVFRIGGSYNSSLLERFKSIKSINFERKIYSRSDFIICAIPTHVRWIRIRFPLVEINKVRLILNGVPEGLCDISQYPNDIQSNKLPVVVTVVGFSQAEESFKLAKALYKLNTIGYSFVLKFIGFDPFFKKEIKELLAESAIFMGPLSHDKVIAEIAKANVLVGILSYQRSRQFNVTSKMFEYVAVPVPIILLNPTRPDKRLFGNLAGVSLISFPTVNDIIDIIAKLSFMEPSELLRRASFITQAWSRRRQARDLASILDKLSST